MNKGWFCFCRFHATKSVLIAAAFCMFNRYVDGLATWAPQEPAVYRKIGEMLASNGYAHSIERE
jgi:hypothetical protein